MQITSNIESALDHREIVERLRAACAPATPIPTGITARLNPLPGIRGVIFDVYGTLFVSAAGEIGQAGKDDERRFRDTIQRYGRYMKGKRRSGILIMQDCIRRAHAAARQRGIAYPEVDIRNIWRETLAAMQTAGILGPATFADDVIERLAIDYEIATNPAWPMPGIGRTLSLLQKRGLALGIVSNAQFFTPFMFEALMEAPVAARAFDPRLCCWSFQAGEAKPSGRMFETIMQNSAGTGIQKACELLYVGNDMLNDIWTAQKAGFRTALFAGDSRSLRMRDNDPRCRNLHPDAVITEWASLPELPA